MSRKSLLLCFLALSLSLVFVGQARANPDPLHIVCTSPTVCSSGSVSLLATTGGTVTFTLNYVNESGTSTPAGEAFVAVLVPNGPASISSTGTLVSTTTFTSNSLGTDLGINGTSDYQFSTFASASAQAGVTATSYTVYFFDVGAAPGGVGAQTGTLTFDHLPVGTVIVGLIETSSNTFAEQTPLSESVTVTPEPGSMALFGSGLLLLGGVIRRRLHV